MKWRSSGFLGVLAANNLGFGLALVGSKFRKKSGRNSVPGHFPGFLVPESPESFFRCRFFPDFFN
jgi:hypothetical protein